MKVKIIKDYYPRDLTLGKVYDVMSVEHGWYRLMTDNDEDYLFPPEMVEVVKEDDPED